MEIDHIRRRLEFVVKISKFCNLRCRYCYELHDLGNRQRMSLDDIRAMFVNIAAYAHRSGHNFIRFIWHGGEPLLIKTEYYQEIARMQAEVFAGLGYDNNMQTNLTILNDDILGFIESGSFIEGIGVSYDPFGTDRVDIRGRSRNEQIINNLQTLIDRNIPFGAISVLTRDTISRSTETFRFFDLLNIQHRLLPYYMSADAAQAQQYGLAFNEIVAALCDVFDAWLASDNATVVQPLEEYRLWAERAIRDFRDDSYVMRDDEFIFIVDVDGGLWGVMDAYEPEARYGNIFTHELGTLLDSEVRAARRLEIEGRVARTCGACPYRGACPGKPVAHATAEERVMIVEAGCVAQALIAHIIRRYEEADVVGLIRDRQPAFMEAALAR